MFAELDEVIQKEMERSQLPGLAIALVKGDGIVWSQGYGYADIEKRVPVTPSTVFSVQSVTKPVVTTALMQWYERGRFGLDDPVNEHLGSLRIENEWEGTAPVSIRHLLTHTSGLPVDLEATPATSEAGPVALEDYLVSVAKTVRPPDEEIVYANWGYDLIGYLVGRYAEQSYDAYLREHVLGPLAMRSSDVGEPPEGTAAATGYFLSALDGQYHATEPLTTETRPPRPCGALFSTVDDLGRFLIAHLNGGVCEGRRVLSGQTVAEMHRLHAGAGSSRGGMGLGFRVDVTGGRRLICHGGDGSHFTAFVGAYPDEKVGVALLINMGRAQTARSVVGNAALRGLVRDGHPSEPGDVERQVAGGEWDRMAGRYLSSFWRIDATLRLENGLPAVELEGGFIAREEGERSYLRRGEDGIVRGHDGPFDGFELTFEFGADGKAARFYGGVYPFCFERQGEAPAAADLVVDEQADVVGSWRGTVSSPLGPVPVTLGIADSATATVSALSAQNAAVEEFGVQCGRVAGHFGVSVPGLGECTIFLRLNATGATLRGRAYARGGFGEVPMRVELTQE